VSHALPRALTSMLGLVALMGAVLALGLVGSGTATADPEARDGVPCRGSSSNAQQLTIEVDGEPATGLFAVPDGPPRGLVVFAHGYSHTAESYREHLTRTAEQDGVIAVAMDYRGTELVDGTHEGGEPLARGWPVVEGAEDSVAAAQLFERRCDVETVVIYGLSMGGNVSGLAAATGAERSDGSPLFDVWIDVEGATNMIETYQAARLVAATGEPFAVQAVEDIEHQTGGTFEQVPGAYAERTVVTRGSDIAASGIEGVILVHGVEDGLVPYNQSREMTEALRANGVPAEMYSVLTRDEDSEAGLTITGTALDGTGTYESPFAGHASDTSTTHTVPVTAFELLSQVIDGATVGCGEFVVDGATDVRVGAGATC
jgi:acetyl esterase/lipase